MSPVTTRRATPTDNTALLALAAACPMRARLTLCVRREPDFFALNRLQGERWDVGVVDGPAAGVIGCIATAVRLAYLNGATVPTAYVSDLKVHPDFRGRRNGSPGVADALTGYARDAVGAVDPAMAVLTTALAGNVAVARRLSGPRGLPLLSHVATIRLRSIPMLVLRRAHADAGVTVRRAQDRDLDEMADLWQTVACRRQFAPVLDAAGFQRMIDNAAGLSVSSYWLARRPSGRLAGFVALWDQHRLKETVVVRYSWRAALFRRGFNLVAPRVGAPRLPAPGTPLRYLSAFQVCVPSGEPDVLRALLVTAARAHAGSPHAFCSIGLDVHDPLSRAVRWCWAQTTLVHAYVTTARGVYDGPPLDALPLHFETALV